tara:strand:+ start:102 stop:656 length:555 start_codon:yes stop_codon:yes gene_type:complete
MAELPFDPNQLNTKDKQTYEAMVAERKKLGSPFDGPYAALMNHPALCQKIEAVGTYLKFNGHLPRNVYQFIVLAVARYTNTAFEWADHVEHALAAGVSADTIQTLKEKGVAHASFSAPYQLAAAILTLTLTWKDIPASLQKLAIDAYGMEGFVEVVVLSGFYQLFSAVNQGFDIPLRDGTPMPW